MRQQLQQLSKNKVDLIKKKEIKNFGSTKGNEHTKFYT